MIAANLARIILREKSVSSLELLDKEYLATLDGSDEPISAVVDGESPNCNIGMGSIEERVSNF